MRNRKCRHHRRDGQVSTSGPIRCCVKRTTRRPTKSRQKLHASLALLPVDATQVDYLYGRLLDAEPHEVPVIRDALAPHKDDLLDKLWAVVEKPEKGQGIATAAGGRGVGEVRPGKSRSGAKCRRPLVNDLVTGKLRCIWAGGLSFRPVQEKLLGSLVGHLSRPPTPSDAERSLATDMLADYAADQPQVLADLLMDADDKQFAVIYPKFKEHGERWFARVAGRDRQAGGGRQGQDRFSRRRERLPRTMPRSRYAKRHRCPPSDSRFALQGGKITG